MSDKNNDQELEKTTDATADEVTSETETNEDRKSTRLNSSHNNQSRMPSSA